jgi:hypothetical protein
MVVLPPLVTETRPNTITQINLTRWRQEVDLMMKSKAFKKEMPVEVLLPLKHFDHWLLMIWDFAKGGRQSLIFKELTMEKE